jgi:hypothetical protein
MDVPRLKRSYLDGVKTPWAPDDGTAAYRAFEEAHRREMETGEYQRNFKDQ